MKRGSEHISPLQHENRKKVNMELIAKIPALSVTDPGGAGLRVSLNLMLRTPLTEKTPAFRSAKPQTKRTRQIQRKII